MGFPWGQYAGARLVSCALLLEPQCQRFAPQYYVYVFVQHALGPRDGTIIGISGEPLMYMIFARLALLVLLAYQLCGARERLYLFREGLYGILAHPPQNVRRATTAQSSRPILRRCENQNHFRFVGGPWSRAVGHYECLRQPHIIAAKLTTSSYPNNHLKFEWPWRSSLLGFGPVHPNS